MDKWEVDDPNFNYANRGFIVIKNVNLVGER